MAKISRESTDPQIYNSYHAKFEKEGIPKDAAGWLERAREISTILGQDVAIRDIQNKSPRAEISLFKSSGLLRVLGPREYGGGGQTWEIGYKIIREVAKGDGSLGMLLGYHLLWSTTGNVVGTEEQKQQVQRVIIENNYFCGGAVNPRDTDLKVHSDGEYLVFNGFKNFNTGGVVSDLTVLEGVYENTEQHMFTFVKTEQPGIIFSHNWDSVGMRLTESGSVKIDNVRVPATDALGWDPMKRAPIPSVLDIPFASLLLPTIQLNFSNMYLGIALGALAYSSEYTRNSTRPWPFGGDNKDSATDEFYILEKYGTFRAHLSAAEALCDRCGAEVARLYADADADAAAQPYVNGSNSQVANGASDHASSDDPQQLAPGRASISARRRGELAALIAQAKVVTTDLGLEVTSGVWEMLGSRATGRKRGFDRFWRDIRTHTLHDPVAYKRREVGRLHLLDEIPEPTWYT